MNRFMFVLMLVITLGSAVPPPVTAAVPSVRKGFQQLAKPGEKIVLDGGHYFTYGFDKQPKIGMTIMKLEIFTRDGKRDTSFAVTGDADMPSMRGAHAGGDKEFALSAKGIYLLPVRLVMPGDWEVAFTFMKKGTVVFRGVYLFDL